MAVSMANCLVGLMVVMMVASMECWLAAYSVESMDLRKAVLTVVLRVERLAGMKVEWLE